MYILDKTDWTTRGFFPTADKTVGRPFIVQSFFIPYENLKRAAVYLDTILFDIKSMNTAKHKEYTGWGNERILENFTRLCKDFPDLPKLARTPVIPGFNDTPEDLEAIRQFLRRKPHVSYQALPYHTFGKGKYTALGRVYPMGNVTLSAAMKQYIEDINAAGL